MENRNENNEQAARKVRNLDVEPLTEAEDKLQKRVASQMGKQGIRIFTIDCRHTLYDRDDFDDRFAGNYGKYRS